MSFPLIVLPAGVSWSYLKKPKFTTTVQTPQSGRGQVRSTLQISPVYEWELTWNVLKEDGITTPNDYQYLIDFYSTMRGSFGAFLFDPSLYGYENLTVTQDISQPSNGFSGQQQKNNYVLWSQNLANAAWTRSQLASVTDGAPGPDTSPSGDIMVSTSGATNASLNQAIPNIPAGWTMTFSIWMRVPSGSRTVNIELGDSTSFNVTSCNVTSTWQQFSVTRTIVSSGVNVQIGGGSTIGASVTLDVAWAHLETGTVANPYYDANSSSHTDGAILPAQTIFPLYRSSTAPGTATFVESIQNVTLLAGIYIDGALQSNTAYTFNNLPAAVTFDSPPGSGQAVSWAGSFNYLVHFAEDTNEFEEFLFQIWKLGTLKLESVQL